MSVSTPREPVLSARPARKPRREELLVTASRLFAQAGFTAVTMTDIGSACGISGPALYHHFESKEAMLGEMLTSISEHLLAGAKAIIQQPHDPHTKLHELIAAHADFATTRPELITVQYRDLVHAPESDRRRVRRLQRRYVEIWVNTVISAEPTIPTARAGTAVHAAFGLLNSTAHAPSPPQILALLASRVLDPRALCAPSIAHKRAQLRHL